MNKEVKDLIDILKEYADGFTSVLAPTEESVKALLDYINQLETKINTYENPEDMTLMFMWCDEKAKDKIKELKQKVNQLETNRDDAIGYIKYCQTSDKDIFPVIEAEKMIEILERGKE